METANPTAFTAPRVRALVTAGYQELDARRQEINDLNVYPVPDGDTGTNLALTIRGVLEEIHGLSDDASPERIAEVLGRAVLMGARGNSGVILSQMVRGAMEVFAEGEPFSDRVIARAFEAASDSAYRAVRKPVEGTMLTVLREMKDEALARAEFGDHRAMMEEVLKAGWESVRRTPEQLEVLAQAGVVDAGGFGLLVFIEGMIAGAEGDEIAAAIDLDSLVGVPEPHLGGAGEAEVGEFTYCTSFVLLDGGLEVAELEARLAPLGDSLLVVGDPSQLKVHVHTNDPGTVLGVATERGSITEIGIDNMRLQTADRSGRLQTGDASGPPRSAPAAVTEVVAVVAGEGNKALFRSMGASLIVEGGQSMNPSAEELLAAVEGAAAETVILLPNNKNVILAAEQAVGMTGRDVVVVPSTSMPAGLGAMVVFDPMSSGEQNSDAMIEALGDVGTAEITRAVRDSSINGMDIREGTYLGLVNGEVVAADPDLCAIVSAVAEKLIRGETEVLTVLLGDLDGADDTQSHEEIVQLLRSSYPAVEVEVHEGGQPLYPLLLAAE